MVRTFVKLILVVSVILLFSGISDALCVKMPEANLRGGPGTKHKKTWTVYKYMPLRELGRKGAWYNVSDVDGDKHWIYKKLVTNSYKCAVVKKESVNIRSKPSIKAPKLPISPIDKYYSFKVIGTTKDWVNVLDQVGNKGWISRKLLWIN